MDSFFQDFWALAGGVLRLDPTIFLNLDNYAHRKAVSITIVFVAGFSQAIGQSIVLFINRVKPVRFILTLGMSALIFTATYIFWVLSVQFVGNVFFQEQFQATRLSTGLGISYAPQMFGFLVALPYLGIPISIILSIWSLLAIVLGLETAFGLTTWQALICAGIGWLVLQLAQRTIGKPLTALAKRLMNAFAGTQLVTDRAGLQDLVSQGNPSAQSGNPRMWVDDVAAEAQKPSTPKVQKFLIIAFLTFVILGIVATSQDWFTVWYQALGDTVQLATKILIITLIALAFAVLLTPLESLGWWAGWIGPKPLNPGVPVKKNDEAVPVSRYVAYLDGINQGTHAYLPEVERFLNQLADSLPPSVLVVKGIIPYSVSNNPLTENNPFAWAWRILESLTHRKLGRPIGFIVNIRNIVAVAVSADPRYGPIQNQGLAQVLFDSLVYHGFQPGTQTPISLIGFSGGGQMSMGSVTFLQQATGSPVEVISLAGVISGNTGAMEADYVFHLAGELDKVENLGAILFPPRWPFVPRSNWNKAKRRGRISFLSLGQVGHSGEQGPMGTDTVLPDGRTHLQQTVDIITGILLKDWAITGLNPDDYRRPSNYELYQEGPFNRIEYYPVQQEVMTDQYLPIGAWLGRLILPEESTRQPGRHILMEVYHAAPGYESLIGQIVRLQWVDTPAVEDYVQLVVMDVHFAEQVPMSQRKGNIHPERINHWLKVDPLESIAGAHPRDDITVVLQRSVQVTGNDPATLLLEADPVHITGRYYGLVKIVESVGDDRFRVFHYNRSSEDFNGVEEIIYLPTVIPNRDTVYQSTNRNIEQSPLNEEGWYIFGAKNVSNEFVVQAIAPHHFFTVIPDHVIYGEKETVRHINFDYWKDVRKQKGQVSTTLLLPHSPPPGSTPDKTLDSPQDTYIHSIATELVWNEGDRGLLLEVYGGYGGNKKEFAPGGIYFGHFSFGIADVIREPLTGKLRFDITYRQIFTHSSEGVVSGSNGWTRFMGDRQFGRVGFRPVSDIIIKFPPFTDDYDFGGMAFSPMNRLIRELDVMAARYRIGDGTGSTFVSPVNSCVQDSTQALFNSLKRLMAEFTLNPRMMKWLREHPDHEQTQRFLILQDLLKSLEHNLLPLGLARADWKYEQLTLGRFPGETPAKTLFNVLASWHSLLPRLANDIITMIFLQLGATVWVIRSNQIGGDDPDIEPLAPTDFGIRVPKIKRVKRV